MSESLIHTEIEGKSLDVHLTRRAIKNLESNSQPVYVRMELYFSCFVKKMVKFSDSDPGFSASTTIDNNLHVSFRPVQSKSCNIHDLEGDNSPTLIDLPVLKRNAIVPRHLFLDCKNGKWKGDFTWNIH
ncbi:MAG: hypothetical protein OEW75_03125 [Cyclobacteriaceae bacterium]|nr:hypothetical protein [Cyclobacteriaceae bacterium]